MVETAPRNGVISKAGCFYYISAPGMYIAMLNRDKIRETNIGNRRCAGVELSSA
jgi:hypothetical protein